MMYISNGKRIRVARGSREIDKTTWKDILKHQLGINQEKFNEGLK